MSEISSNIILVILATSLATYLSRFLGVVSSEKMDIKSKIFRWFNCIAYAILAALIARIVVFPAGVLAESSILIRLFILGGSIFLFFITKKNLVYPTVLSAIILTLLNNYFSL
jgi:branched-subunit amino acid transport protein